jgi:hypothetical protein
MHTTGLHQNSKKFKSMNTLILFLGDVVPWQPKGLAGRIFTVW